MPRRSAALPILLAAALVVALAGPATAQEDPATAPEDPTSTTEPVPDVDDVGDQDAPPEEPPPAGEVVDPDLAALAFEQELQVARADVVASAAEVADAARLVDALTDRLAELQGQLARLDVARADQVDQLEAAEVRFRERVANAVVRGNAAELDSVMTATDPNHLERRMVLLASVSEADQDALAQLQGAAEVLDDGVVDAVAQVAATRRELRTARDGLEQALRVNTERKFELAVFSAGSEIAIRGFVFPVAEPYSFIDSWGYPRMVGTQYEHGHQGVDVMAPFGTPLYAVEEGVLRRVGTDVLGGTKLWLEGRSGTMYYYAHLQSFAEGVADGVEVEAGDVIGFVGDTGNARGGAPHLHFEVHPHGGDAVNPYGLLRVVSDLTRQGG